jgi:peptide/nickel transport system substrate-binding protein
MKTRYHPVAAASIVLCAMLAMPASAQQPKPQYGGELVLTGQLDKTMFPGRNTDAQGMDVYLNSCETLVELTADREIRPLLAEGWTASADKKTVTFKLRQGVQFHDGTCSTPRRSPRCSTRRWPRNSSM